MSSSLTGLPLALLVGQESEWAPEGEAPYFWMIAFLGITVVFLALDLITAFKGKRRAHITLALITVPLFLAAVYFADSVGHWWNIEEPYLTVHLSFAITAFFMAFIVVGTGAMHTFKKLPLAVHRTLAFIFVGLVLVATGTGILMFSHAQEKPKKPPGGTHAPVDPDKNKNP